MPSHRSTPGSSTQRRSPHDALARSARCRSRSGLIRASARRQRRRRCAASSTLEVTLEHRHHGRAHLRRGGLELLRHDTGPVPVEPARAHRLVQPTQPGLGRGALGPVGGQQPPPPPPAARRAPTTPPAPPRRSPARPTPRAPTPGGTRPRCRPRGTPARSPPTARSRHPAPPTPRRSPAAATPPRPPTAPATPPPPTAPAPQSARPPQHRPPPPPASGPAATTSRHPPDLLPRTVDGDHRQTPARWPQSDCTAAVYPERQRSHAHAVCARPQPPDDPVDTP